MKDIRKDCNQWKPGYYFANKKTWKLEWIDYKKSWFCNENKIIHHNKNQLLNCKICNKIWK